ncbi:hypothetical protein IX317_001720 [Fusobacterium sp. DD29]|uniref:type II toxin-antitoxin system death-on-curing family toxin n=1 Tax=unclassified Fusobacterium TaxID=2648384 RepID=UPI001B8C3970|nr:MULTISPECIES: Fic family protein [unclassified Fusobacterium]MBR8702169.1 hypothetical protein [Fusobacterium sp. DD45]MBR8711992.1 hypothetical protein [Fusobacterium sp. DD28]MBR8750039.1 hypothetical protein [Fusobacterium sp. DD29]MBR8752565.1 hypothetical protein [Fusobacterium sp. DD26]MBR8762281.1 hypothetical protein [Fusobacterium sp. DD25]
MSNFINNDAKLLYDMIISLNKTIVNDSRQAAKREFSVINEGTLINYCNSIFSYKPFSTELLCESFEEGVAYTIYHLNKGHCFSDGNKRTTFAVTMLFIETFGKVNFDTEFFSGVLAMFLVYMLDNNISEKQVYEWVKKQFSSKF